MNLTVIWALKKAWTPLSEVFEDTPVILISLAISIHRDCYALLQLYLQSDQTASPVPGPPWDPWDVTALGTSAVGWILYAFLPSLIF